MKRLLLGCIIILHTPTGHELRYRADAIQMIMDGEPHHDHVTHGANSLLFTGGAKGQGVLETPKEVAGMIEGCTK